MKIEDCKIGMIVGAYSKTHGVITGELIDLIEDGDNIIGVVETETHNIEVSISKLLGVLEWANKHKLI